MNNTNSSSVGLPVSSAVHDVALELPGEPRVLNKGSTQSLVHGGGESQLQLTAYSLVHVKVGV